MGAACKGTRRSVLTGVSCFLLLSVGCGEVPDAEGTDDAVSRIASAYTEPDKLRIVLSDNRAATNGVLTLRDQYGNTDSEAVRATLYPPADAYSGDPANESYMSWSNQNPPNNRLAMIGFGPGGYLIGNNYYSNIKVGDFNGPPSGTMRVTLRVYITGNCHEDYEDIDWTNTARLYFNGNGGTWDGSCYRGNFLRTRP